MNKLDKEESEILEAFESGKTYEDCRKKPLLKAFLIKRWLPASFTNM